jgi:hypothetical protein
MELLQGAGTANPVFTGPKAMREFGVLIGANTPTPVSVENTGGSGTRDGHWRDSVFGNELMTGFLSPGMNPLSRMTAASLQDMGYTVSLDDAQPYALPSHLHLSMMGVWADDPQFRCHAAGYRRRGAGPVILPKSAVL